MIKDIVVNLGLGDARPGRRFRHFGGRRLRGSCAGRGLRLRSGHSRLRDGRHSAAIHRSRNAPIARRRRTRRSSASSKSAKRVGVSYESLSVNASIAGAADRLGQLARRFDLAIVGQPNRDKGEPVEVVDEGVLFESGRPVIFVPYIQKAALKLDRVMVCWDGSRAATRAVADSLPFLQKAKQVEIVIVASKGVKADEAPGADLAKHLARHGLQGRCQAHHLAGYRCQLHHFVLRGR